MDKATATEFVQRIEAHREQELTIWKEMRDRPDYEQHEDKVIVDIIEARKEARTLLADADSNLDTFNWVDDGTGNFVPREAVGA